MVLKLTGLDIIIGPMFSGKTTELLRRLSIYKHLNLRVLCINHSFDVRNDQGISTHSNYIDPKRLTNYDNIKTSNLLNIIDNANEYDIIGIDEAQFFGVELLEFVEKFVTVKTFFFL